MSESTTMTLRLPRSLLRAGKVLAAASGETLSGLIRQMIRDQVELRAKEFGDLVTKFDTTASTSNTKEDKMSTPKSIDPRTLRTATEKYGADIAASVLGKGGTLEDCKTAYAQNHGMTPGMAQYAGSVNQSQSRKKNKS